jgi:hypothetical protein
MIESYDWLKQNINMSSSRRRLMRAEGAKKANKWSQVCSKQYNCFWRSEGVVRAEEKEGGGDIECTVIYSSTGMAYRECSEGKLIREGRRLCRVRGIVYQECLEVQARLEERA